MSVNKLFAQEFKEYKVSQITLDNGLSLGYTRDVLQDTTGLIWITNKDVGLNVYDGHHVTSYYEESDETYLPIRAIQAEVLPDHNFVLSDWSSKLYIFNPYSRKIVDTIHVSDDATAHGLYDFKIDNQGGIWALTFPNDESNKAILYKADPTGTLQEVHKMQISDYPYPQLIEYQERIYINSKPNVYSFAKDGSLYDSIAYSDNGKELRLYGMAQDDEGNLWMKSGGNNEKPNLSGALFKLDGEASRLSKVDLISEGLIVNSEYINIINDDLWFGGLYESLIRYDMKTGHIEDYSEDIRALLHKSFYILGVIEDNDGNIWVTTSAGLFFLNENKPKGFQFILNSKDGFCEANCRIQGMARKDSFIYIAYPNQLIRHNSNNFTSVALPYRSDDVKNGGTGNIYWDYGSNKISISENQIVWQDDVLNLDGQLIKHLYDNHHDFRFANVQIGKDIFWLMPYYPKDKNDQLYEVNITTGTMKKLGSEITCCMSSPYDMLVSKYQDKVWITTITNRLFEYNKSGKLLRTFNGSESTQRYAYNYSLHEDQHGSLWMGTTVGIGKLAADSDTIQVFINKSRSTTDASSSIGIRSISQSNDSTLWLGGIRGVHTFDINREVYNSHNFPAALRELEATIGTSQMSGDGRLYIGTTQGVVVIDPQVISQNSKAEDSDYDLALSSYSIYNTNKDQAVTYREKLAEVTSITLQPSDSWLSFNYTLPHYQATDLISYSYRIEELSDNWSLPSKQNEVQINKLEYGTYTLSLRASMDNDPERIYTRDITLDVKQYWYQSGWFYLLMALLFSALVFSIQRYLYHLKKRRQEAIQNLRTKISHDLHDEVGGLLTGLSMQSELLELKVDDTLKPRAAKIKHLGREAVSQIRDTVWAIDSSKDDVQSLYDRMKDHADMTLGAIDMPYNFDITKESEKLSIAPDLRQQIYLIYKEAITNISKHSNGSYVNIIFRHSKSSTYMTIYDNGSVNKMNQSGIGMSSMKKRADNINGKLDVDTKDGFRVVLRV